jgi:hypothetical protein
MGGTRSAYDALVGKSEEIYHLKDLGVDGTLIFEWILRKYGRLWTGFI